MLAAVDHDRTLEERGGTDPIRAAKRFPTKGCRGGYSGFGSVSETLVGNDIKQHTFGRRKGDEESSNLQFGRARFAFPPAPNHEAGHVLPARIAKPWGSPSRLTAALSNQGQARRTAASSRRFQRREDCLGLCRIAAGCHAPGSPAPRQIIASDLHRSRGAAAPRARIPQRLFFAQFLCAILSGKG